MNLLKIFGIEAYSLGDINALLEVTGTGSVANLVDKASKQCEKMRNTAEELEEGYYETEGKATDVLNAAIAAAHAKYDQDMLETNQKLEKATKLKLKQAEIKQILVKFPTTE